MSAIVFPAWERGKSRKKLCLTSSHALRQDVGVLGMGCSLHRLAGSGKFASCFLFIFYIAKMTN